MNWTDKLIDPLAKALKETGPWLRVEPNKSGGWLCLGGNVGDPAIDWHHFQEDGTLTAMDPMKDKKLPAIAKACSQWISNGYSIQLLAWRVGSRSIFRMSRANNNSYAKIFRRDRLIIDRWEHLSAGSPGGLWRVPAILSWDEEDKILVIEDRPGHSLNQQWISGIWIDQHLVSLQQILDWLGHAPISDKLPVHTVKDEEQILNSRLDVFHQTLKEPHANATSLVNKVIKRLNCVGDQELIVCHRDLHDKQIITAWEGGSIIDLDLLAIGSPALDVGNIIAHCLLRAAQGLPIPWQSVARILSRDAFGRGVEKEALTAWTASTLARIAMIYARRKRHPRLIVQLLASLEDLLENRGEWAGVID